MHALLLALLLTCPHDSILGAAARAARVPPAIVLAVARVESNCDPAAVSATGARGLMQILPSWARTDQRCERLPLGERRRTCESRRLVRRNLVARCGRDLHDPATSACFGARILRYEFHRTGGHWRGALRAYSGAAYPNYVGQVLSALRRLRVSQRQPETAAAEAQAAPKAARRIEVRRPSRPFGKTGPHLLITAKAVTCQRCQASAPRIGDVVDLVHQADCPIAAEAERYALEAEAKMAAG